MGWDLGECLAGFYDALVKGNIAPKVLLEHQFRPEWINSPALYKPQILLYLQQKCKVDEIMARALSKEQLQKIRLIGTNLTRIKKELINDMITNSANLTELQVRLYCPFLINNSN